AESPGRWWPASSAGSSTRPTPHSPASRNNNARYFMDDQSNGLRPATESGVRRRTARTPQNAGNSRSTTRGPGSEGTEGGQSDQRPEPTTARLGEEPPGVPGIPTLVPRGTELLVVFS